MRKSTSGLPSETDSVFPERRLSLVIDMTAFFSGNILDLHIVADLYDIKAGWYLSGLPFGIVKL